MKEMVVVKRGRREKEAASFSKMTGPIWNLSLIWCANFLSEIM